MWGMMVDNAANLHQILSDFLEDLERAKLSLIIQVTHPPLGQYLRGVRGGGREPGSSWCTAPVPDRATDRGRSSCDTPAADESDG